MIFAYADPPYPGEAKRHYSRKKADNKAGIATDSQAEEVDLETLFLELEKFDAWALSSSSSTLAQVLAFDYCPDDVRIGAWVKPFCAFRKGVNPVYAWEPLIYRAPKLSNFPKVRDWVRSSITTKRGVHGAKPDAFCDWLFCLLGASPADEFVDLFPGSGAVTAAWERWRSQEDLLRLLPSSADDDDDQADELPRQYKGTWAWEEVSE